LLNIFLRPSAENLRFSLAFTSRISNTLRKIGLLGLAEQLRFRLQQWKYRRPNRQFRQQHAGVPMPPDFFIYETYRLNLQEYYDDGKTVATEILTLLGQATDLVQPSPALLDWGCGPGRITRHLQALLPGATVHGCDYNEKYIDWCTTHLAGIYFFQNGIDPPLQLPNDSIDALIGISIFTHLSANNHVAWINELLRVMKKGGAAFITTQGDAYRKVLLPAELALFDKGELVIRENFKEGNRLFAAFEPPVYMRQLVKDKFEVVQFIPATGNKPSQDCWVLRKL
jgi:SAM-dependent methyltransferase